MRLTINNDDGRGDVDYTTALRKDAPLTIVRARGAWARCRGGLDVLGAALPVPSNRGRAVVKDDGGAVLFAGYLERDAAAVASAESTAGAAECVVFTALEDAWLTQAAPADALQPVGTVTHAMALRDVALAYESQTAGAAELLAGDVTVSGEVEAAAYVTELFRGDGTTQTFALLHAPLQETGGAALVREAFDDVALNAAVWVKADPGSHIALGDGGLKVSGGTGVDGATLLSYMAPVEMGGTLVAEMTGVSLAEGSDGVLLGFYGASVTQSACVAGLRVVGTGGAQTFIAVVNGVQQSATYAFAEGHAYTLRVRLHCAELQRLGAVYQALVDGVLHTFGGATVDAALRVVMEVVDEGLASSTLPTVLFDGAIASSPATCTFAPVNSTALVGSVGGVSLTQGGSAWVVVTATDGSVVTQREGAVGTGSDVSLTSTGVLSFAAGRVPGPGALVTATYRRGRRAVARVQDAAAVESQLELGLPGLPTWSGHVAGARSGADCVAAAQALLALRNGTATARAGHVEWVRGTATTDDVQPGDTVRLSATEGDVVLPVQVVTITEGNCQPELLRYRVRFAQGRAESLSFAVVRGLAADVVEPIAMTDAASSLPAALGGLQVTTATDAALQVDCGVDAVGGGGFEVRRSDANFGAADTSDLVLTSAARSFSVPRAAFAERFFVRMFDGASPRKYSAVSSVVLTHLPVS